VEGWGTQLGKVRDRRVKTPSPPTPPPPSLLPPPLPRALLGLYWDYNTGEMC